MTVLIDFHKAISKLPKPKKTCEKKNCACCSAITCPRIAAYESALEKIADALLELEQ